MIPLAHLAQLVGVSPTDDPTETSRLIRFRLEKHYLKMGVKHIHSVLKKQGYLLPEWQGKTKGINAIMNHSAPWYFSVIQFLSLVLKVSEVTETLKTLLTCSPKNWRGPEGILYHHHVGMTALRELITSPFAPKHLVKLRPYLRTLTKRPYVVYALASFARTSLYIGSTVQLQKRIIGHYTRSLDKSFVQPLYRILYSEGPWLWFVVPLVSVPFDLRVYETIVIKRLQPRLNAHKPFWAHRRLFQSVAGTTKGRKHNTHFAHKTQHSTPTAASFSPICLKRSDSSLWSLSLTEVIRGLQRKTPTTITWKPLYENASVFAVHAEKSLMISYKSSVVILGNSQCTLTQLRKFMEVQNTGQCIIVCCEPKLHLDVLFPTTDVRTTLSRFSNFHLLDYWVYLKTTLTHVASQSFLLSQVHAEFRCRNIPLLRNCILRVSWDQTLLVRSLRSFVSFLFENLLIPLSLRRYWENTCRILPLPSQNIADILCNHIKFAKNFDPSLPPACLCGSFDDIHTKLRPQQHDNSIARRVLSASSKNVPSYDHPFLVVRLYSELLSFASQFSYFQNTTEQEMCAWLAQESANHAFKNHDDDEPSFGICSLQEVLLVRAMLPGLFVPLDKNPNQLLYVCPKQYFADLLKATQDDVHYVQSSLTEEQILELWSNDHTKSPWEKWAKYNKGGSLPYFYVLYKEKDISRLRPIVSCVQHPLAHLRNIVGRVLWFLLEQSDWNHYSLFRLDTLQHQFAQLSNQVEQSEVAGFILQCFDVKNCYTELPHQTILEAVTHLLQNPAFCTVTVNSRGTKGVEWGSHPSRGRVVIHLDHISSFVAWSLNNSYFRIGTKVLKQIRGVPQGGADSLFTDIGCSGLL